MVNKRKHVIWGICGIYLFLFTFCVLISGTFQTINTLRNYTQLGLIGFNRVDYEEFAVYMYIRFALFLSVGLIRIIVGGITASCLIVTPSAKRIKTVACLLCLLAACTVSRGLLTTTIGVMTFADIPQAVLFFVLSKKWGIYQNDMAKKSGVVKEEWFPFFKEFGKNE